jgi:branched-chain amino acid transport system permease protein
MKTLILFFVHGITYSGLLFLIASGLTMVFSMMRIMNFAHASFYMLAAYISYSILLRTGQFWLCMLLSPIALFVIGSLVEKFLIRRVHSFGLVYDLLLTFGLGYALDEMVKWIWGTMPLHLNLDFATSSITVFDTTYPVYRLFILAVSILVIGMLILILFKTNLGIIIRAAVDDSEMANALGINIPILFNGVFAFGAALAALAGVVAAPLFTVSTDLASLVLIDGFVVVILGGLGSLGGAVLSSFLIGQLQSFGSLLMPQISMIFIYVLMAVVLVFKPSGLMGDRK